MITDEFKVEKKESQEYPPLPKDVYEVELLDITSESIVTYNTRNKPEAEQEMEIVLSFQFTLLEGMQGGESLRVRNVWANFIPTYLYIGKNGKNKLYKIIEAFLGAELTPEQEATIDTSYLNSLVGKNCRISVEPKTSGDKTFDNITDWLPTKQKFDPLNAEEKEKASVKKDKELPSTDGVVEEEINIDNVKF